MTREEIIKWLEIELRTWESDCKSKHPIKEALKMAIEALEQEPRKDEVILTNKEYRELMANEYDHGYCKGYAVALEEQESILNKIRAEIDEYGSIWVAYAITGRSDRDIENLIKGVLKQAKEQVLNIIDKYRTESEE